MTRHFTYEIDERKLRVKLKDLEVPFKDSAWDSFEQFSNLQSKSHADARAGMKISLNRNALMLSVFAVVIVSFSMLLFNFISIKNPKKDAEPLAEATATEMQATKPEQPETKPPVQKPLATVTNTSAAAAKIDALTTSPASDPAKLAEPVLTPEKTVAKAPAVEEMNGEELELLRQKQEELRKIREQKAAAALAKQIRPTVITEDTDPDVRPE